MKTLQHLVPNGAGWLLSLTQTWDPANLDPRRKPVLIVPGYGMNSFIFGYHPRGVSMEGTLARHGFEVWRVDLRAQGASIRQGGGDDFGLGDLAADLGVATRAVLERTRTTAVRADVIGASLGGTILFTHLALEPGHVVGSMVAMGSPLRWVSVHPAVKILFASPMIAGLIRVKGTRRLAEIGLPLVARYAPNVLSIYMNPEASDVSAAREMVRTVEDPNRFINREIARWIRARDLVVAGTDVVEAFRRVQRPLLCIVANGDGIVPQDTAQFPYEHSTSPDKGLVTVGTETLRLAHADLFVSNAAHEQVFRPLAEWLAAR